MEELQKPAWLKMKEDELVKHIKELADKNPPSKIGTILRDQYGIPTTKLYGKKLGQYLKELGLEKNEEFENAVKKVEKIKEHLKANITDRKAKHKLQKAQSKVSKARKYFERKNKEWKKYSLNEL